MSWTVETLGPIVDDEIAALPVDMQAAFLRLAERIEAVGIERIGAPHLRHLRDKLWEMRMSGRDGIARAIHITSKRPTGCRSARVRQKVSKNAEGRAVVGRTACEGD